MKCSLSWNLGISDKIRDLVAPLLPQDQVLSREWAFLSAVTFPDTRATVGVTPGMSAPGSTRQVSPRPR